MVFAIAGEELGLLGTLLCRSRVGHVWRGRVIFFVVIVLLKWHVIMRKSRLSVTGGVRSLVAPVSYGGLSCPPCTASLRARGMWTIGSLFSVATRGWHPQAPALDKPRLTLLRYGCYGQGDGRRGGAGPNPFGDGLAQLRDKALSKAGHEGGLRRILVPARSLPVSIPRVPLPRSLAFFTLPSPLRMRSRALRADA